MDQEILQQQLAARWPDLTFGNSGPWLQVQVKADGWKDMARALRHEEAWQFDFLFCLTCIDWTDRLTMVYHLRSTKHRHDLVVKTDLDRSDPVIDTVCDIWRTAEFHEREVYELFGVRFHGHPDLRRLILPDEWKGWPLRKDYEDPVNMIKL